MYVINAYAVLAGSLLFLLSWTLPYQSSDHFKQKAAVSPTLIKSLKQIFFVNYNLSENTLTVDQIPSLYLIWKYQHLFNISHYFTICIWQVNKRYGLRPRKKKQNSASSSSLTLSPHITLLLNMMLCWSQPLVLTWYNSHEKQRKSGSNSFFLSSFSITQ